jgi:hypothetical protein
LRGQRLSVAPVKATCLAIGAENEGILKDHVMSVSVMGHNDCDPMIKGISAGLYGIACIHNTKQNSRNLGSATVLPTHRSLSGAWHPPYYPAIGCCTSAAINPCLMHTLYAECSLRHITEGVNYHFMPCRIAANGDETLLRWPSPSPLLPNCTASTNSPCDAGFDPCASTTNHGRISLFSLFLRWSRPRGR